MIPLIKPRPPKLSEATDLLRQIEESGLLSNFGPVNTRFEQDLTDHMFGGTGACLTVCNATLGLMLAIQQATEGRTPRQKYALMPSFTFAAAAQAALWCGLIPLFCDIDAQSWAADAGAEEELLRQYRGQIAVVVPYATFGYDIDLSRYTRLRARHGVPVVVDAAASLGTTSSSGHGFGTGFNGAVVFSMHATKSFSTAEGGVIHSADEALIQQLRTMSNFGFGQQRTATMPGLNAKLSEVGALIAHLRLAGYGDVITAREALMTRYRENLPALAFQPVSPLQQAHQFAPALLPRPMAAHRDALGADLKSNGIGMANYFSPHLAEQPYFIKTCVASTLKITHDVASRIISLPIYDGMTMNDVDIVSERLSSAMNALGKSAVSAPGRVPVGSIPEMSGLSTAPVWRIPTQPGSATAHMAG